MNYQSHQQPVSNIQEILQMDAPVTLPISTNENERGHNKPFSDDPLRALGESLPQQPLTTMDTSQREHPTPQNNSNQISFAGLYSNSGFDMISILAKILNRPNPQINIGPIDMSCSFLVTDMRQYDCPIVYCSPNFETLTGYRSNEIIGRNCRFLQAPDGQVTMGSRRQYTDNVAIYHLKSFLEQGKEHQVSIINYRKGGQPFVNLVTVIPVPDEAQQTAFLVGLQVDLVEQPNAILEKMKDGTYCVNYQQINIPPYIPGNGIAVDPVDDYFREIPSGTATTTTSSGLAQPEIVRLVNCDGQNEQQLQQEWNKLLIDQSVDFIHVLSLKGFFLYCSRSCSSVLEYDPEELVGHSLSSITHPSDIVPVMRDIKNAASDSEQVISFLFRIRRKYSGYMWMECQGKLHVDQSKGKKCLILAGRERPVYRLPFKEIANANDSVVPTLPKNNEGEGENVGPYHSANPLATEFWAKMTLEGLYLRVSPPSLDVIGHSSDGLQGSSIYRYAGDNNIPNIAHALVSVSKGSIINLQHTMRNQRGQYVPVVSTFYPGDVANGIGKPTFALVQTRLQDFNKEKYVKGAPFVDSTRTDNENLFPELETVRGTSWQYELHQLQQANAKLRVQIEKFNKDKKNKKKKNGSTLSDKQGMICAQCHRTNSPEWRKGPNGPRELCNGCGLKYAKSLQASKAAEATTSTTEED